VGLLAVAGAALCSGAAVVLQAVAARRLPTDAGLGVGLVRRLAGSPAYLAALLLVALGFGLSFVALRTLPLFVVQAGRASGLAVAAVLAVLVLGARFGRRDAAGLVALGVGLVGLAVSVAPTRASVPPPGVRVGLLLAALALAVLAWRVAARPPSARSGMVLAVAAGVGYAVLAFAAHVVDPSRPLAMLLDPALWAGGLGGVLALALTALALRRAAVVPVTAATVATETCLGALLGLVLVGDRALPGRGLLAAAAFVLVLGGALTVARFGASESLVDAERARDDA
jgi:drug/metabolite transporter (DMT)-like permease